MIENDFCHFFVTYKMGILSLEKKECFVAGNY